MMSSQPSSSKIIPIDKVLELKRFHSKLDFFLAIIYAPIGLSLFLIRFFIFVHIMLISSFWSSSSSFRSLVYRSLFFVLGISINIEDENLFRSSKNKFIIANSISDVDPLVMNLLSPCVFISARATMPFYIQWMCNFFKPDDEDSEQKISNSNLPVICFPETCKSNGKFGLIAFKSNSFKHVSTVNLIFLESKRLIIKASLSTYESNWIADLFWVFYLPFTIFKIRAIGNVSRKENESLEVFAKRIQKEMADRTNLSATNYTHQDLKDFIKKSQTESRKNNSQKIPKLESRISKSDCNNEKFSQQIKEILPFVPINVIREDVYLTKDIDATIERILIGKVQYKPLTEEENEKETSSDQNKGNFGSKNFGQTSTQRIASFQERRDQMYRIARVKYLQKYMREISDGMNLTQ
ncbi:Ancient ubiquitous protein 1 [Sarcoptes scabiei]|uniref:Ancient ubiquitous protein 1 n=1 Tax=Sarcoptes scabiei TaxID=52283 RepID=A0A834R574_SARSC|nr:Ancient ubiquitous protein 1 [Sarcoptes scabiei]